MTSYLIIHMKAIEHYLHVITFIYAVQDSTNFLFWVSLQTEMKSYVMNHTKALDQYFDVIMFIYAGCFNFLVWRCVLRWKHVPSHTHLIIDIVPAFCSFLHKRRF